MYADSSNCHEPVSIFLVMRVLVAESELRMAALLRRILEERGHAVDVVSSGADALAYALRSSYGAIVVEQLLPTMDAAQMCARLRARGSWAPVLMTCPPGSVDQRAA